MKALRLLSVVTLIFAFGVGVTSCNQVNDADIQSTAQELLDANPELAGITVTVQNKVATLTGTVSDDSAKSYAESVVAGVKNVTSVVNQVEVIPPASDHSALDAAINAALPDALKDHATVTATVQDGVITLNGEIKESDLQVLMEKLNALNPVQVVNNLTVK
ncbi:Osmotically-inducible protein OsmY, contains BON domain [Porphyromonadaceae bacterium NLAE-zl-C104]|nr:Osmotically-inducible protein OsmY, contains BON domain [Porphyromonadaceae bacterium NLAE-zl-C104]